MIMVIMIPKGDKTLNELQPEEIAQEEKKKKPFYKRWWLVVLVIIVIGALFYGGYKSNNEKETAKGNTSKSISTEFKFTEEESLYISKLTEQTELWSKTLETLNMMLKAADVGNEEWRTMVSVVIKVMQGLSSEAKKLDPPGALKDVHDLYLEGVEDLEWVAYNLPKGIDNLDIDIVNECAVRMKRSSIPFDQATKRMIEINNNMKTKN